MGHHDEDFVTLIDSRIETDLSRNPADFGPAEMSTADSCPVSAFGVIRSFV